MLERLIRPEELVFMSSTKPRNTTPPIAVLQSLNESKFAQIKKYWSSVPRGPEPHSNLSPTGSDSDFADAVRAQLHACIFSTFPLRVMKLPEMKLMERSAIFEYIIQNNFADEVHKSIADAVPSIGASEQSKKAAYRRRLAATVKNLTKFAVLSHTWEQDEPSHQDFQNAATTTSRGYKKLQEFCRIAYEQYGVEFAWADTVCINKLSSSELDESIRSMFTWYRESSICIIYLADTDTLLEFPFDRWFTRGWTLQELLAPMEIKFYNKDWQPLTDLGNDKLDPNKEADEYSHDHASHECESRPDYALQLDLLRDGISEATGIPIHHIYDFRPGLQDPPFPERMKWIAQRTTTRPEDLSYSMMGVLGISISVAYGEGLERAFFRLFQAALEVHWSPSWFLWGGEPIPTNVHPSRMIPSSPACYLSWDLKCEGVSRSSSETAPIALTNTGLPIKLLVIPARVKYRVGLAHAVDASNPFFANITCPLSDDIVMTSVPRDLAIEHDEVVNQFALGVLSHDVTPVSGSGHINAILLHKKYSKSRYFPLSHGSYTAPEWSCGEWERCTMKEALSFDLKEEFGRTREEDWVGVDISGSEIEWIDKLEIGLRTLYL